MHGGARWWPHLLPVRVDRKATRQMRNGGCRYQAPRRWIEVTGIRASHGTISRPDPIGMLTPTEPCPNQARRCRVGRCPAMRGYRPTQPTGRAGIDLVGDDLAPRRISVAGTDSLPLAVQFLPGRVPRPLLPRPLRGQLSWGLPPPAPRLCGGEEQLVWFRLQGCCPPRNIARVSQREGMSRELPSAISSASNGGSCAHFYPSKRTIS